MCKTRSKNKPTNKNKGLKSGKENTQLLTVVTPGRKNRKGFYVFLRIVEIFFQHSL